MAFHLRLECRKLCGPEDYESREAVKHHAMAVNLVKTMAKDNDSVGAVMALACYCMSFNSYSFAMQ
jgi:hypothetical protein